MAPSGSEASRWRSADAQEAFADADAKPDILIPDVAAIDDRVLITPRVGGVSPSRVIAEGTRDQRSRAGTAAAASGHRLAGVLCSLETTVPAHDEVRRSLPSYELSLVTRRRPPDRGV
jgi:hypothetical protein